MYVLGFTMSLCSTESPTEEHCFLTFSEIFENIALNRIMRKPAGM
jgi:hypothetical protein